MHGAGQWPKHLHKLPPQGAPRHEHALTAYGMLLPETTFVQRRGPRAGRAGPANERNRAVRRERGRVDCAAGTPVPSAPWTAAAAAAASAGRRAT
jgi:hypothetical protein